MSRKAGFAGVLLGCLGSVYLLYTGISSLAAMTGHDDSVLVIVYGFLSLLVFLLSAYLLKNANWKCALYCGAALPLLTLFGVMSVGLYLLPGSLIIFIPSAIHRLEHGI